MTADIQVLQVPSKELPYLFCFPVNGTKIEPKYHHYLNQAVASTPVKPSLTIFNLKRVDENNVEMPDVCGQVPVVVNLNVEAPERPAVDVPMMAQPARLIKPEIYVDVFGDLVDIVEKYEACDVIQCTVPACYKFGPTTGLTTHFLDKHCDLNSVHSDTMDTESFDLDNILANLN